MSKNIFVTPIDKNGFREWNLDVNYFISELTKQWPKCHYKLYQNMNYSFVLLGEITLEEDRVISFGLPKDCKGLFTETSNHIEVADLIAWYRNLVPSEYKLYLMEPSGIVNLELLYGITAEEIIQQVNQIIIHNKNEE